MSPFSAIDSLSANAANLRRLFWLRNIAIAGQLVALAFVIAMTHMQLRGADHVEIEVFDFPIVIGTLREQLPLFAIGIVITGQIVFNMITGLRLRRGRTVTQREFFAHLLVDVVALTGLLYFAGGATNPFTLLFLLPVTIAAAALPGGARFFVAYTRKLAGLRADRRAGGLLRGRHGQYLTQARAPDRAGAGAGDSR